ncbi:MAG: hypothetical protein HY789_02335 [Deltaproteobacteria bacterium]|nr:hypothetical protein [Deltaproteobacteria bacterium]
MKITNNLGTPAIGPSDPKNSKPLSGNEFKNFLESQIQSVSTTAKTGAAAKVAALSIVPAALRIEGLSVAEATINSLESLGTALSNLQLPAEDLAPLVEALEEETGSILDLKGKLPAEDPLARLLDRVATISYVETAKFRRGDYQ